MHNAELNSLLELVSGDLLVVHNTVLDLSMSDLGLANSAATRARRSRGPSCARRTGASTSRRRRVGRGRSCIRRRRCACCCHARQCGRLQLVVVVGVVWRVMVHGETFFGSDYFTSFIFYLFLFLVIFSLFLSFLNFNNHDLRLRIYMWINPRFY